FGKDVVAVEVLRKRVAAVDGSTGASGEVVEASAGREALGAALDVGELEQGIDGDEAGGFFVFEADVGVDGVDLESGGGVFTAGAVKNHTAFIVEGEAPLAQVSVEPFG